MGFNPNQPRDSRGRWAKGGGAIVVLTAAIAMASGATTGAGGAASGAAESVASRTASGKSSARKGKRDEAWRKLNLREVRKRAENAVDCAVNSYGEVRRFFVATPCRSLDRALFTVGDSGGTFVVSVSWVRLGSRESVAELERLALRDGTGSVTPLADAVLGANGVRFTGDPYRTRPDGTLLVIAEAAIATGRPDPALVEAAVEVAKELPAR